MRKILITIFVFFTTVVASEAENYNDILDLINNHNYSLAEKKLIELLLIEPSNITYLTTLSDVYISQNKFQKAKELCIEILEKQPYNYSNILKLSQINSWMGKFKDSVKYYSKAIDIEKSDITPYIEKARVLGWWGKSEKAIRAYMDVYHKIPEEWIKYEAEGKKKLWNGRLHSAIHYFEKSLNNKPDNNEILFDIAQIYSYAEDFKRADKYYSRLLDVNPYHTAGVKSQRKNQIYQNAYSINNGLNYWGAKSLERNTDVKVTSMYLNVSKRFERIVLGTNFSRENYRFSKYKDLEQNSVGVSLSYQKLLVFGIGAGLTTRNLINNEINRESYYVYLWYKIFDSINLNANFTKSNMINNYRNIINNLNDTSNLLKIEYQAKEFLIVGGNIKLSEISDDNSYRTTGIYSKYLITKQPRNLYTMLEAENIRYEKKSNDYFAPSNYSTISTLIGFRHDIGKEGQYYGANKIYYELKYKIIYDSNNETSNQPSAELYSDINNKFNIGLKYLMTESNYYDDNVAYAQLKYIF